MPTNGGPPATSTAHGAQPSRAISSEKRSIRASLSAREGDEPNDSTTSGWVFNAKKGSRSMSVNGRNTNRAVRTVTPAVVQAPAPALAAVSAAQR